MKNFSPGLSTLFIVATYLFLTGCQVRVPITSNRLESPETIGKKIDNDAKGGLEGSFAYVQGNSIVISNDVSTVLVDQYKGRYEKDAWVRLTGGFAILDKLDLSLRIDPFLTVRAKYQLLGEPRARMKAGNFSIALSGGVGYEKTTTEGESFFTTLGATSRGSANFRAALLDGALIVGYRPVKAILLYGGGFVNQIYYDGDQTITNVSTNAVYAQTNYAGSAFQSGANLGLELGIRELYLRGEAAYANVNGGNVNNGRLHIGVQLGTSLNP